MIMVLPTMFRDTQNRYEPNLPFAQIVSPTMFRDNQNPNEPNLPFSQSPRGEKKYQVSIVGNGTFGNKDIASANLTQGGINYWRSLGYTVTILGSTTPTTPTPTTPTPTGNNTEIWTHINKLYDIHKEQEGRITEAWEDRKRIEKLKGVDYGVHIKKLYDIHGEQEDRITAGFDHRTSIEEKVETGIAARDKIHNTLSDLGRSVSDVSNALSVHSTHDLIPNPFDIQQILPYVLIGGVAILAMSGRKSRK